MGQGGHQGEIEFSLKDGLFDATSAGTLAAQVADASTHFDRKTFFNTAVSSLPNLELKARIAMLADLVNEH
jgi:hypothetical protein